MSRALRLEGVLLLACEGESGFAAGLVAGGLGQLAAPADGLPSWLAFILSFHPTLRLWVVGKSQCPDETKSVMASVLTWTP
jgi:hypothetical protein